MDTAALWTSGTRPTRAVARVYLMTFINLFGNGLVMAYQLIYLTDVLHIGLGTAGLIMGAIGLASLIAAPATGMFTDRFGALNVLLAGWSISLVGCILMVVATGTRSALIAAIVFGFGMGASWAPTSTLIATLTAPATRSRAFAIQRMAINAAVGLGAVVGGYMADEQRPWTFRALFIGNGATFVVAGVAALSLRRALPSTARSGRRDDGDTPSSYRDVFRDRPFASSLIYDLATGLTFAIAFDLFPKAFKLVGFRTSWIGLVFAVNTAAVVILQLAAVRLAAGRRRLRLMQVHLSTFAVGYAICWYGTTHAKSVLFAWAVVAAVVFAVGECLMGAVRSAMVVDMAPEHLVGRYNAATTTLFQVGMSIGRPIGALALKQGQSTLWLFGIIVVGAGVVHLGLLEPRLNDQLRRAPALAKAA